MNWSKTLRNFTCLLCLLGSFLSQLPAQTIYLSRVVPGKAFDLRDAQHRIDIFNPSARNAVDLSGYMIITRQYIVRLPEEGVRVAPASTLKLGKVNQGNDLDFAFTELKDFVVRVNQGEESGDFVALLDRNLRLVDGVLFSEERSVSYLPVDESFIAANQDRLSISLPEEGNSRWAFLPVVPDPAIAFVRINQVWKPNSLRRNLFPATEYRIIRAQYVKGIVSLKFQTMFEDDCYAHVIERRTERGGFREIGRKAGATQSKRLRDYMFYDDAVETDQVYYYRLKHVDKFGNVIYSPEPAMVITEENPGGFSFDIIEEPTEAGRYLNIRFSAEQKQEVRIKLLDEELRQLEVLFYGEIEAEKQNLINYDEALPYGIYYLLVETDMRRYRARLVIEGD
ncbi:MAG: hypothetical protein AAFP92_20000 [Bacteroidota bacterium]